MNKINFICNYEQRVKINLSGLKHNYLQTQEKLTGGVHALTQYSSIQAFTQKGETFMNFYQLRKTSNKIKKFTTDNLVNQVVRNMNLY